MTLESFRKRIHSQLVFFVVDRLIDKYPFDQWEIFLDRIGYHEKVLRDAVEISYAALKLKN